MISTPALSRGAEALLIVGISIFVLFVAILFFRRLYRKGEARCAELIGKYEDVAFVDAENNPPVDVTFYVFYGCIVETKTVKVEMNLPYTRALDMLDELHRFNVRWSFMCYGALFIPIISYFNRRKQKKLIRRALHDRGIVPDNPYVLNTRDRNS